MPATIIESLPASSLKKHDVITDINFWKRQEAPPRVVDLRLSDAEREADKKEHPEPEVDVRKVTVHDIRGEEQNYTLLKNGFQIVKHEVSDLKDWSDPEEVKRVLIPATEELVKKTTGAFKTFFLLARIRNEAATGQSVSLPDTFPAYAPHSDMTAAGAQNLLGYKIRDPEELAALKAGRVMVVNVWRPLKTITRDPLALCDWQSLDIQHDIVPSRLIFQNGGWHESSKIAFSEKQKWCYLSHQRPDEPVLFMQYDDKSEGGLGLPHTAVVDPKFVEDEARQSIEIKMFAFLKE